MIWYVCPNLAHFYQLISFVSANQIEFSVCLWQRVFLFCFISCILCARARAIKLYCVFCILCCLCECIWFFGLFSQWLFVLLRLINLRTIWRFRLVKYASGFLRIFLAILQIYSDNSYRFSINFTKSSLKPIHTHTNICSADSYRNRLDAGISIEFFVCGVVFFFYSMCCCYFWSHWNIHKYKWQKRI